MSIRALGLLSARLADSGELPSTGGVSHGSVAGIGVLGLVQVNEIYGIVKSEGAAAVAAATVSGLKIDIAGIGIAAGAMDSAARATCSGVTGGARIAGLSINGLAVNIKGEVNETIDLGVAKIVLNEQVVVGKAIVVHALHLTGADIAEIALATSRASVDCPCGEKSKGKEGPPPELPPPPQDPEGKTNPGFGLLGDACDDKTPCANGHHCVAADAPDVH